MGSRICILAIGLALFWPLSAAADGGDWIDGVYGDEAGCALHADDVVTSDNLIIVTVDQIRRFEAVCPISAITEQGSRMLVDVQCTGEGESFTRQYIFEGGPEDGFVVSMPDTDYQSQIAMC